jgi:hypothetical protein
MTIIRSIRANVYIRIPCNETLLFFTALLTNNNHQHNGMEGTKFLASQAKSIYHYKSIRSEKTLLHGMRIYTLALIDLMMVI